MELELYRLLIEQLALSLPVCVGRRRQSGAGSNKTSENKETVLVVQRLPLRLNQAATA